EFNVVSEDCSPSIPPRSNCNVDVTFSPTVSGGQSGQLIVQGQLLDAVKGEVVTFGAPSASANLNGNAISGGQLLLPPSIDMGAAQVGGATITYPVELRNTGYGT